MTDHFLLTTNTDFNMKKLIYYCLAAAVMVIASCTQQPQYATRVEKILAEINDPNSEIGEGKIRKLIGKVKL